MDTETTSPSPEAEAHLDQAYAYYEREEFEQALLECETTLEIDPALIHAHHLQGLVLEELGRTIEAKEAYQQAFKLDPGFSEAQDSLLALEDKSALLPHWLRKPILAGILGISGFLAVTYVLEWYLSKRLVSIWDALLFVVLITLYTPGLIVRHLLEGPEAGQELFNWTIRGISSLTFGYIGVAIALKRKKVLRLIAILFLPLYLLFFSAWVLLFVLGSALY